MSLDVALLGSWVEPLRSHAAPSVDCGRPMGTCFPTSSRNWLCLSRILEVAVDVLEEFQLAVFLLLLCLCDLTTNPSLPDVASGVRRWRPPRRGCGCSPWALPSEAPGDQSLACRHSRLAMSVLAQLAKLGACAEYGVKIGLKHAVSAKGKRHKCV